MSKSASADKSPQLNNNQLSYYVKQSYFEIVLTYFEDMLPQRIIVELGLFMSKISRKLSQKMKAKTFVPAL
jgi:hypothetical protein